jgi:hypothetical protein
MHVLINKAVASARFRLAFQRFWCLDFVISLELGIWNLELIISPLIARLDERSKTRAHPSGVPIK